MSWLILKWWKPLACIIGGVILLMSGWGVYKLIIANHAVKDAQLDKDYHAQLDSTAAWKTAYAGVELARKNLHDSLNVLDGILSTTRAETNRWRDTALAAKGRLIVISRPSVSDSTNPKWMHRSIELETTVAAQDKELAGKDVEISLLTAKQKLLLSQMSKDSVALYSANGNIDRLNKLVEGFKAKSECKVALILPCLSRTQSFIAGALATGIGSVLVNKSQKK